MNEIEEENWEIIRKIIGGKWEQNGEKWELMKKGEENWEIVGIFISSKRPLDLLIEKNSERFPLILDPRPKIRKKKKMGKIGKCFGKQEKNWN